MAADWFGKEDDRQPFLLHLDGYTDRDIGLAAMGKLREDFVLGLNVRNEPIWFGDTAFRYSVLIGRPDFGPKKLGCQIRACHTGTFWCEGKLRETVQK